MLLTLIMSLLALALPFLIITASIILSMRSTKDREKNSPFECGFDPKATARLPFSLRFFLLAVLFLVFDIEIVLLLPSPFSVNLYPSKIYFITLNIFLCILLLGLFHEWNEGSLDWSE